MNLVHYFQKYSCFNVVSTLSKSDVVIMNRAVGTTGFFMSPFAEKKKEEKTNIYLVGSTF